MILLQIRGLQNDSECADLPQLRFFGSTFAVLALQDYYSGNSTYNGTAANGLLQYIQNYGFYGLSPTINSDSAYWGLALFYAYRTYRQQTLLDQAVKAWNVTYANGFITPDDALTGTGAGRNISFLHPSGCAASGTPFVSRRYQLRHLTWQ